MATIDNILNFNLMSLDLVVLVLEMEIKFLVSYLMILIKSGEKQLNQFVVDMLLGSHKMVLLRSKFFTFPHFLLEPDLKWLLITLTILEFKTSTSFPSTWRYHIITKTLEKFTDPTLNPFISRIHTTEEHLLHLVVAYPEVPHPMEAQVNSI